MKRTPSSREHGYAMVTTMLLLAALLPLGAYAALEARLGTLVERHVRSATETFYVAESGLEHALADLTLDGRFERLRNGPDRVPGSADDGRFPFRNPPAAFFPRPPFRYEVRIRSRGANRIDVVADGFGPPPARRTVAALLERSATPYVPAALFCAGEGPRILLGHGFAIHGEPGPGSDPGTPALALVDEDAALALGNGRLGGTLEPDGVAVRAYPALEDLAKNAARSPTTREIASDGRDLAGSAIFLHRGPLEIADARAGGLLVVDGPLRVSGDFSFSGLVVVLGDVVLEPASGVNVHGAVLQGSSAESFRALGDGSIRYDPAPLEDLDALLPGLLPHRIRLLGRRELA